MAFQATQSLGIKLAEGHDLHRLLAAELRCQVLHEKDKGEADCLNDEEDEEPEEALAPEIIRVPVELTREDHRVPSELLPHQSHDAVENSE